MTDLEILSTCIYHLTCGILHQVSCSVTGQPNSPHFSLATCCPFFYLAVMCFCWRHFTPFPLSTKINWKKVVEVLQIGELICSKAIHFIIP